ncbi:SpoU rRNA methylase family protein [Mucilaginibacter frigoritolerans]|jgi:23S rRNA (guanosine2251-2'-O)-methyltransferase|uniref:SpoU rRNA methylase family protein n=1 Tax=Mucilaginibacter frigoritolerans TaxID=652788 RepID=A0A562TTA7_9SPHI|nr:RNA methyltransferase [Mucilaginibacter frigoritolerans]TWI96673.1 SpoU rRNA methylase family protein [Mucilaginibacter frigoritolerans]
MRKLKLDELNRVTVDEFKAGTKFPVVVVLDNVRSMHNIGSVFRTADGFAVEQLCLCGITAQPPHREIEKTALGATQSINWKYFDNTLLAVKELQDKGYKIVAVEQAAESIMLNDFMPEANEKYALIFGNEVNGVDEEVMKNIDACIEIPQFGTKHSFNIVVSAGIVLWDLFSKMVV